MSTEMTFGKDRHGCAVIGVGGCDGPDVEIPAEHDGKPVVRIAEGAFRDCGSVESVCLPDTVTDIGDRAFAWSSVKRISVPGSLKTVGFRAFEGCRPDAVDIGDLASWCSVAFAGPESNPLRRAGSVLVRGKEAYNLVIPEGVERIADYAFCGCRAIMSITLPESLKEIGRDAFRDCYGLSVVCNGSQLRMEADVGDTGNGFVACYARRVLPEDERDKVIKNARFEKDGFIFYDTGDVLYLTGYAGGERRVVLPAVCGRTYEIGADAFSERGDVYGVEIPDSVTEIGRAAFCRCRSLREVRIGNGVRRIGDFAFEDCFNLERAEMGASVETIGGYAFRGCTSLRSAPFPKGLKTIGERAFNKCFVLRAPELTEGVAIGDCAFQECGSAVPFERLAAVKNVGLPEKR